MSLCPLCPAQQILSQKLYKSSVCLCRNLFIHAENPATAAWYLSTSPVQQEYLQQQEPHSMLPGTLAGLGRTWLQQGSAGPTPSEPSQVTDHSGTARKDKTGCFSCIISAMLNLIFYRKIKAVAGHPCPQGVPGQV